MKRKNRIFLILSLIILIGITCFCIIAFKSKGKNYQQDNNAKVEKTNQHEGLVNITEYSEGFMEEYFEEVKEIEDKENVLIVSSKEKIENTYGATKTIEAPNNQYILQYESAEKKDKAFQEIKKDTSILSVEENIIYETCETEYNSWGIEKMSLDYATKSSKIEILSDVTVAIIDTGCDMRLFNKYYSGRILETYNVLEDSTASSSMVDENGHGTHIAGTIAEATPLNVKILPIKVSRDGKLYNTDIITAINYITYNEKADVINMSFGSYYYSEAIEQAINSANNKNIICVAAAGNGNTSNNHYPSALDNTISIASVNSNLTKSGFSNYGSSITFTAPGTNIKSIMGRDTSISRDNIRKGYDDEDDDHETISGTSMATPHAVSAVAILKSYNKNLNLEDVIELLKKTAIDLGDEGWDKNFGFGLISFKDVQFREDDINTDEYRVYKQINKGITNIELMELKFTPYNYYSLTNIMASKIKVYYANNTYEEKLLWELPNLEVLGYIPTEENEQTITIKTGEISLTVDITNPSNYESGWEYSNINQLEVKITGYKSHELNIGRLDIPEKIDEKDVKEFEDNIELSKLGNDFSIYEYLYLPSNFKRIGDYSLSNTNIKYVYGNCSEVVVGNHGFEASSIVIVDVPIIEVGDYAFKDCFELVNVDIPGEFAYVSASGTSIAKTSIGDYAFYNCKKLIQIKQSKNYDTVFAKKIGKFAFYNCISLAELEMEPNRDIGEYAFYNCYTLTNIDLYNVDSIGIYAFYSSGISEAELGLIDEVKESSFENCRNLKAVSFTSGSIGARAFWNAAVENVSISSMVDYIAEDAFAYCPIKDADGGNTKGKYYCMSNNGIIENDTKKLIVGFKGTSGNTQIPNFVTEIGNYAFTGNNTVKNVIIPESVTKIGEYAFKDCYQLSSVYMLGDNIEFGDDAFTRTNEGDIQNSELFIYVHKDSSNIRKYLTSKNLEYRNIEPDEIIVIDNKKEYRAFDKVDEDSLVVKLIYHEENNREEILSKMDFDTRTVLTNTFGVGFQCSSGTIEYGDTYYTLHIRNIHGYEEWEKKVEIEVLKAIPDYTVPTNLTGSLGQMLAEIKLPKGFEWMDETQIMQELGNVKYKAKYIPTDTINYEIVENIDIIIDVKYVIPQSISLDKTNLVFNILEKQKLTATIMPENATNKNVIWKSTNTNIAKVDQNGEVTPVKDGRCEIICGAEIDPENINAKCTVIVDNTLQVEIMQIYNEDNTVTVNVESKYPFKGTNSTWTLSEDKKTYKKIYNTNGAYSEKFEDIYSHQKTLTFSINEIKSKYNIIKTYDKNTNTVTVSVVNNFGMKQTKPTWKLSSDQKTYAKVYNANGKYTTQFVDAKGAVTPITFEVTEIDNKAPNVTITKVYNSDKNTVTVKAVANEMFGKTKPTWTLSNDCKIYTKEYNTNGTYTTAFKDIYGNERIQTFTVNEIKSKYNIIKAYDKNTNTVTVSVVNNFGMKQTKPTWKLSSDQKTYVKVYNVNGKYTTQFVDTKGTVTPLTFEVTGIDVEPPKLMIANIYNSDKNTVTVKVTSNEILGKTKPTWTLSNDKKTYTKEYNLNGTYTTVFKDLYGNETKLTFIVSHIESKYQIIKTYNKNTKKVTVSVINNFGMQQTKPTWKLSEDRRIYTKGYSSNGTYSTTFVDTNGISTKLTFTINEI